MGPPPNTKAVSHCVVVALFDSKLFIGWDWMIICACFLNLVLLWSFSIFPNCDDYSIRNTHGLPLSLSLSPPDRSRTADQHMKIDQFDHIFHNLRSSYIVFVHFHGFMVSWFLCANNIKYTEKHKLYVAHRKFPLGLFICQSDVLRCCCGNHTSRGLQQLKYIAGPCVCLLLDLSTWMMLLLLLVCLLD